MKKLFILYHLFFVTVVLAQTENYQLLRHVNISDARVGDKLEFSFYFKNNSSEEYHVTSAESMARAIKDVLRHEFLVFNSEGNQINRLFNCGIGGKGERRFVSGVLVKPGDSALLVTRTIVPTSAGQFQAEYIFDFHPELSQEPTPEMFKKIYLKENFTFEVKELDYSFKINERRISAEELRKEPVILSINDALRNPNETYRLRLNSPSQNIVNKLPLFKNLQELTLVSGGVDSIPADLFKLYFRSLNISLSVANGLVFPKTIQNATELEDLTLNIVNGLDLSALSQVEFPKLKFVSIQSVAEPMQFGMDVSKMPNLESLRILRAKSVLGIPDDFSTCSKLKTFEISAEEVEYGTELILTNIHNLNLIGKPTNGKLPNLTRCLELERLSIHQFSIDEIPSHILEISSLKQLSCKKEMANSETAKELKKRGIEIKEM